MNVRERLEMIGRRHGWTAHYTGYQTNQGLTLRRRGETVQIDTDKYRGRIIRAVRTRPFDYGLYLIVAEVGPGDPQKLRQVTRMVER
jgi:hypothetical protein